MKFLYNYDTENECQGNKSANQQMNCTVSFQREKRNTNGQQLFLKVFSVPSHQGNAN